MRLVRMAPFRCHDCGARFAAYSHPKAAQMGREQSLAEYLGLWGREYKVRQWLITIVMTLLFLAASIVFLLRAIDI